MASDARLITSGIFLFCMSDKEGQGVSNELTGPNDFLGQSKADVFFVTSVLLSLFGVGLVFSD